MNKGWLIALGVVAVIAVWGIGTYNSLVSMNVGIDTALSQVQVQYQRRFDLIPNLVATVKGVANFEQSTYVAVTEARSAWQQSLQTGTRAEQVAATENVQSALSRLLVTVENYPQLKANENFKELQAQIEGTENRIAVARKDYNEAVQPYNIKLQTFPSSLIARVFGFEKGTFFGSDSGAEKAPVVNFGTP